MLAIIDEEEAVKQRALGTVNNSMVHMGESTTQRGVSSSRRVINNDDES
jgi:hypothetical protein